MRKLWVCSETVWGQYSEMRSGIRIRFEKGVSEEVRQACIRFIRWLRAEYCFPVRVHLYFKKSRQIKSIDGELASAAFWGPYDKRKNRIFGSQWEIMRNCGMNGAGIMHWRKSFIPLFMNYRIIFNG